MGAARSIVASCRAIRRKDGCSGDARRARPPPQPSPASGEGVEKETPVMEAPVAMVFDLAPQLGYQTLPVIPWPDVEADIYETCRTLADHLERYRQLRDVTPSVTEEEGLLETVSDLIDQALERPVEFGLNKAVADDIGDSQ